jgi:hypothetical protein
VTILLIFGAVLVLYLLFTVFLVSVLFRDVERSYPLTKRDVPETHDLNEKTGRCL